MTTAILLAALVLGQPHTSTRGVVAEVGKGYYDVVAAHSYRRTYYTDGRWPGVSVGGSLKVGTEVWVWCGDDDTVVRLADAGPSDDFVFAVAVEEWVGRGRFDPGLSSPCWRCRDRASRRMLGRADPAEVAAAVASPDAEVALRGRSAYRAVLSRIAWEGLPP